MTPFDSILHDMQLQSSLFVHLRGRAPWAISFDSGGQARLVVIAKGHCWFTHAGQPAVLVEAGDCLIIKQGVEGILGDVPDREAIPCTEVANHVTGHTVVFGGCGESCEFFSTLFTFDHAAGEPLSALLPDAVHVKMAESDADWMLGTLERIGREEVQGGLGAPHVVGRLLDILFIQAIRTWALAEGSLPGGWLAGLTHRRLAKTLHDIHADITRPWTLEELARNAAMSRSSFAALFKSVVGVPPLTYIATWRIYRAKLLLEAGHSIAAVAIQTGYGTDIALSRAFKSATGMPPGQWRRDRAGVRERRRRERSSTALG